MTRPSSFEESNKKLGEDVDDFVVRTKSKTDQIIKDYTAVASNAYKGISVLDENGNLRNTYDILLDISKVYKEIQETDKKAGTNRAAALVETLAGRLARKLQKYSLLYTFKCVDCLKLYATIFGKPEYEGLTNQR